MEHFVTFGPVPNLDLTPFAFLISGMAIALSLFRFRLLDLVPVAWENVKEGMTDGMVVLDLQDHVVDINPAAERFLGCSASDALGRGPAETEVRVPWRSAGQVRFLQLSLGVEERFDAQTFRSSPTTW